MTLRPGETPGRAIAVFPFLKTTDSIQLGTFSFRSTDDTSDLEPEDATHVREIADMLFLKDDLRVRSASYAMLPPLDLDKRDPGVPELERAGFCPNSHGGKNWPPIAFSPKTRMIYIPANNNLCGSLEGTDVMYEPGKRFTGVKNGDPATASGSTHVGEVQAWNVDTGKLAWSHHYAKSPNWGSMLATAGGLVFTGGTNDRKIHAFDASNGNLLWEFPTNSGILAPPTSFLIDGRQYVAVLSGWGGDARGMEATLNRLFPGEYPEVPEGGALWVFAVE